MCWCSCRYSNAYDWRAFVAALACSGGIAILWSACALLLRKTARIHGPGISVLMRIPGMKAITATPDWSPDYQQRLPVSEGVGSQKDVAAPIQG